VRYREVEKKLRRLGCEEIKRRGGGSHRRWYNPTVSPIIIVSVPDWGSNDLKMGTLRAVIKNLGFEWDEFLKS
jgi:mRNA interferase HicA